MGQEARAFATLGFGDQIVWRHGNVLGYVHADGRGPSTSGMDYAPRQQARIAALVAPANPGPPAKPVIGKPQAQPTQARAGGRFAVAFQVAWSDGTALSSAGTSLATTVAGKAVPHQFRFAAGQLTVSLRVPEPRLASCCEFQRQCERKIRWRPRRSHTECDEGPRHQRRKHPRPSREFRRSHALPLQGLRAAADANCTRDRIRADHIAKRKRNPSIGDLETPGARPSFLKIALRVFKTEPAALASFNAACRGCELKAVGSGSWKFKQRLDLAADGNTLTLVARCRNVRVDTTQRVYGTNPHVVAGPSKRIIEGVFLEARSSGMSPCAGTGSTPPTTGTYYWSESYAENMVVTKVKIPACNIPGAGSTCGTQSPYLLDSAVCRGLDERPGTFTYSRFTCDIRVGYQGRIGGRIAVWPTGPSTLKWRII